MSCVCWAGSIVFKRIMVMSVQSCSHLQYTFFHFITAHYPHTQVPIPALPIHQIFLSRTHEYCNFNRVATDLESWGIGKVTERQRISLAVRENIRHLIAHMKSKFITVLLLYFDSWSCLLQIQVWNSLLYGEWSGNIAFVCLAEAGEFWLIQMFGIPVQIDPTAID